jgi:Rieske Fe-S protein
MDRRAFVKTCTLGTGLLAGSGFTFAGDMRARAYHRVQLLAPDSTPLRATDLVAGEQYVFHYPFPATPCFLLDLGRPLAGRNGLATEADSRYDWPGGVGPQASIVAYSAICAHKMAHPTRSISYISYRAPRNDTDPETGVISCCAENSLYDPAAGAAVLDGPAPQPLAAILLEHEPADDGLYAVGTLGGEMFQRFFSEFGLRLSLENPSRDEQMPLSDAVRVMPLADFSGNVVRC